MMIIERVQSGVELLWMRNSDSSRFEDFNLKNKIIDCCFLTHR